MASEGPTRQRHLVIRSAAADCSHIVRCSPVEGNRCSPQQRCDAGPHLAALFPGFTKQCSCAAAENIYQNVSLRRHWLCEAASANHKADCLSSAERSSIISSNLIRSHAPQREQKWIGRAIFTSRDCFECALQSAVLRLDVVVQHSGEQPPLLRPPRSPAARFQVRRTRPFHPLSGSTVSYANLPRRGRRLIEPTQLLHKPHEVAIITQEVRDFVKSAQDSKGVTWCRRLRTQPLVRFKHGRQVFHPVGRSTEQRLLQHRSIRSYSPRGTHSRHTSTGAYSTFSVPFAYESLATGLSY